MGAVAIGFVSTRSTPDGATILYRRCGRAELARAAGRGFSNRVSLVNGLLLPPWVTVLFAVEIVRRNIWFEARAPQGPQRANAVASLRPDPRSRPYLRPGATITSVTLLGWISTVD
jgi:hypothetical protein